MNITENKVVTRFAPSPTGLLHIGNARAALLCWLHARKHKGKFILRIDNTDKERCSKEFEDGIYQDLKWLGIDWDLCEQQTAHQEFFTQAFIKLRKDGFIYPCYETKEELEIKRKLQLSSGQPPIYDRQALKLSPEQIEQHNKEGKKPHWRFKISYAKPIIWDDLIKKHIKFDPEKIPDPIVVRSDGSYTYLLISVISDIHHKVTDIIRGEDHITNTAIQIQMFEALNQPVPKLGHLPLMKIDTGKISKRNNDNEYSIRALKEHGILPITINNYLLQIGLGNDGTIASSTEELIKKFDICKYSSSTAIASIQQIEQLNAKILHNTGYQEIILLLDKKDAARLSNPQWLAIRGNIKNIEEIRIWLDIMTTDFKLSSDKTIDKNIIIQAIQAVPNEWNSSNCISAADVQGWLTEISKKVDKKPKDLFLPIRLAITGMNKGPELFKIIQVLGKAELIKRLEQYI